MLCWAISDMLPPKADAHMHMLHICHMYPVWLYVVPAVSYLFGLEVRNREPAKTCICESMCVLIYLTVNIPPWPSMTVITSCWFFLLSVSVCVPLYAVLSHLLNIIVAPSGRWNKGVCSILYSNLLFRRWTQNQLKNKHEQRQINLRCHDACFIGAILWYLML